MKRVHSEQNLVDSITNTKDQVNNINDENIPTEEKTIPSETDISTPMKKQEDLKQENPTLKDKQAIGVQTRADFTLFLREHRTKPGLYGNIIYRFFRDVRSGKSGLFINPDGELTQEIHHLSVFIANGDDPLNQKFLIEMKQIFHATPMRSEWEQTRYYPLVVKLHRSDLTTIAIQQAIYKRLGMEFLIQFYDIGEIKSSVTIEKKTAIGYPPLQIEDYMTTVLISMPQKLSIPINFPYTFCEYLPGSKKSPRVTTTWAWLDKDQLRAFNPGLLVQLNSVK